MKQFAHEKLLEESGLAKKDLPSEILNKVKEFDMKKNKLEEKENDLKSVAIAQVMYEWMEENGHITQDTPPAADEPPVVDTPPVDAPVVVDTPPVDVPPVVDTPPVDAPVVVDTPPVDVPPVVNTPPVDAPVAKTEKKKIWSMGGWVEVD